MTITKADLINQLKGMRKSTSLYFRTSDESMEGEIVTERDIIYEYVDETGCEEDPKEIDVDDAIQGLADFNDSIQFYEISKEI